MLKEKIRPLCFWAWNGDMNHGELCAQLKDLAGHGMGGVLIHSRAGLKIPYMGEKWFEAFGVAIKECEKLGLQVYIYDEDGWPSGFAGGRVCAASEEFHERYLLCAQVNLPEGKMPDNVVAVYKKAGAGFIPAAKGNDDFKGLKGEYTVIYAVFNRVYIDILNRDAVRYFIKVTHEEYKKRFGGYFGGVIKGIFTDEPHFSPNGIPWGKYIPECFEKMHGYSVYDALPYMFFKEEGYYAYRYDFWKNISDMMASSYSKPYYEWCCENNLIFTGHYACEEGQVDQIAVNGGVMPLYELQHMPGVDSLGNRLAPAPVFKQAEAVAWQLGDKKVLCETYACSGYDATFSDIMWIWGYQAALGVNVPCLSISMYTLAGTCKRDYPVFFSQQMPWWDKFNNLAKSFDFINNLMADGERGDGILLIHPKTSVWCEKGRDSEIEEKSISADFRVLTESLIDLQKDFDYGDEHILQAHAEISGGYIVVGNRKYTSVIMPPACNIQNSTLRLLKEFSGGGGTVIFISRLPSYTDGRKADKKAFNFKKTMLACRTDLLRKYFLCFDKAQEIELIDRYTRRTALGFVTAVRDYRGEKYMLAVNRAREEKRSVRVKVKGKKGIYKITLNGNENEIYSEYDAFNGITCADIEFDGQEACVIKTGEYKPLPKSCVEEIKYLKDFDIDPGENIYIADRASYKIDNGEYCAENYTIFLTPDFYGKIDGLNKEVKLFVRYIFTVKEKPESPFSLCCEYGGGRVYINGAEIFKNGYFLDKGFGRFDISGYIKEGQNEVIIEKRIGKYKSKYNLNEVFQSVTNVFSYEYYIENIFITGRFDCVPYDSLTPGENCFWMSQKGAYISAETKKTGLSELTKQGMLFYAGKVRAKTVYSCKKEKGCRYVFEYGKPDFAYADLRINGKIVANLGVAPYNIDITDYLADGENMLEFDIYSTARNMLGPFHHIKGRHNYVGHTVYKGYVEFEDPVVFPELVGKNTWTNSYSFAPLGLINPGIRKERY